MKEHEWKVGDEAMFYGEKWTVFRILSEDGVVGISRHVQHPFGEKQYRAVALSLLKPVEKPELRTIKVVWNKDGNVDTLPTTGTAPLAHRSITVNPNHPTVREMAEATGTLCIQRSKDRGVERWWVSSGIGCKVFFDADHNNDPDQSFDAAMRWVKLQIDKETSDD